MRKEPFEACANRSLAGPVLSFPTPIRFLHLRRYLCKNFRKYHILPMGGITVGYSVVNSLEHKAIGIVIAIARCRNDELYNKKTGRELVVARLGEVPRLTFDPTQTDSTNGPSTFLVYVDYGWIHRRVRKVTGVKPPLTTDAEVAFALLDENSGFSDYVIAIVAGKLGESSTELDTVDNLRRPPF